MNKNIEEAFERCGLEAKTGYDLQTARRSMNIMLAEWANRGLNLWTIDYATETMTPGTNFYSIKAITEERNKRIDLLIRLNISDRNALERIRVEIKNSFKDSIFSFYETPNM